MKKFPILLKGAVSAMMLMSLSSAAQAEYVPINPELGSYELIGTYNWTIKPTDMSFGKGQSDVTFKTEVRLYDGDEKYYVAEVGETNYLNGNLVPFTYADGAKTATFEQYMAGTDGSQSVFFSPFTDTPFPEIYPSYLFNFSPETGFTFDPIMGFGWFNSSTTDGLTPTEKYVSIFYLMGCEVVSDSEPAIYPAPGEFDGFYTYSSPEFKLNDTAYADVLSENIEFEVVTSPQGTVSVINFIIPSVNCEYDELTGELTLNSVFGTPAGSPTQLGIAPVDGGWKGFAGLTANKLKFRIGEDGTITIPDFDVVTFSGTTVTAVIAEYRNGVVIETEGPGGGGDDDVKSFAGTYSFKGTKYTYPDGNGLVEGEAVTEPLNFDLVINDNNQIISIGGYTLDEEQIGYNRNHGVVEGNSLVLEAAPFVGVQWQIVYTDEDNGSNYTDSLLLGGDVTHYDQLDPNNKIVFTLNEDGTYSLEPFTLWHRYQSTIEGSEGEQNTTIVCDIVYRWESEAGGSGDASIVGEWDIPLNGHYQGAYSMNNFVGHYEVSLDGTYVTFTSVDSDYNIIGEFIDETTIEFNSAVVVPAVYSLVQVPYINTTGTDEIENLTEQPFSAIYNPADGTITFPENSGIAYGRFNSDGQLSFWDDAFDFNGKAVKTGDIQAVLTISNMSYEIGQNSVSVTYDIAATGMEIVNVTSWKARVTESFSDKTTETDWTETAYVDATVANGKVSFEIPGLSTGNHDFIIAIVGYDVDGEEMIVSNEKALSVVIGADIMIRNIDYSVLDGEDDNFKVAIGFEAVVSGISESELSGYKVRLLDNSSVTDANPAGTYEEYDATLTEGIVEALVELPKGYYDFTVTLVAYDNADAELVVSNRLQLVIDLENVGVDVVTSENGNVRYYNMQGVEISNPENGIFIKVEGNKASKVVIR